MATRRKMKWGISSAEPEDLPDFKTNAEIGLPPVGLYRFRINRIRVVKNKNKDDMMVIHLQMDNTQKNRAKWNGYFIADRQNVTDDAASYTKRFLTAVGVSWKEFMTQTVMDTTADPPEVSKMGKVVFDSAKRPVHVWATTARDEYEGEKRLQIGRYVKPVNEPKDEESDEDIDAEDEDIPEDDEVEVEDEGAEEPDDIDEEPEDEDEMELDEDELREELEDLDPPTLRARLKENGVKLALYKGKRKPTLIDLIVEAEMPTEDEEAEPEDEEPDEEEPEDDLDSIDDVAALKSRARAAGLKLSELKGHSKAEVRDMIREKEAESPF